MLAGCAQPLTMKLMANKSFVAVAKLRVGPGWSPVLLFLVLLVVQFALAVAFRAIRLI